MSGYAKPHGKHRDQLREVLERAERQGWRVSGGGDRHYKLMAPNGRDIVVTSGSTSDRNAIRALLSRMRRTGCYQE